MTKLTAKASIFLFSLVLFALLIGGCAKTETGEKAEDQTPQETEVVEEKPETKPVEESMDEEIPTAESDGEIVSQEKPKPAVSCSDPAPSFSLRGLNGEKVNLEDYAGKVVLLDFWATWCRPCVMAIPDLVALQSEYGKDSFVVIGISLDRQPAMVPRFAEKAGINYPIAYGFGESVAQDYGNITSIPTAIIVDKNGCIKQRLVGLHPKSELQKYIKPLLGESV
ncbi:MAG: TlpA family protein disulfide reductase [bacterium]